MQQMVVNNRGEVGILEVVAVDGKTFFDLLLDKIIDDGIGLTATRRSQYGDRTKRIHHVYPSPVPFLAIIESGRQIDRVLVFQEPCLLHKGLVLLIEDILHQVVLQESAHIESRHQQTNIAYGYRKSIENRIRLYGQRQGEYPPIEEEKDKAGAHECPYLRPSDMLLFHALCTQTGKPHQYQRKELGVKHISEQPRRAVEIHQYPVHHTDIHAP